MILYSSQAFICSLRIEQKHRFTIKSLDRTPRKPHRSPWRWIPRDFTCTGPIRARSDIATWVYCAFINSLFYSVGPFLSGGPIYKNLNVQFENISPILYAFQRSFSYMFLLFIILLNHLPEVWFLYHSILTYTMILNDCHIHLPQYLHGASKSTVILLW